MEQATTTHGRGKAVKEPMNEITELRMSDAAKTLRVPITTFRDEYHDGVYDGAFILRGSIPFFVVHLVKEIQRKRAKESAKYRRAQ